MGAVREDVVPAVIDHLLKRTYTVEAHLRNLVSSGMFNTMSKAINETRITYLDFLVKEERYEDAAVIRDLYLEYEQQFNSARLRNRRA